MINENYFENIDTELKGYILGLILYNIKSHDIVKKSFVVEIVLDDDVSIPKTIINKNREIIQEEFNKLGECHYHKNNNALDLKITSQVIIEGIKTLLNVDKFLSVCDLDLSIIFEKIPDIKIQTAFIKAYVEKYGDITFQENGEVKLQITFYFEDNIQHINKFNIPYEKLRLFNLRFASFCDVNLIDFMGILYKNNKLPIINYKHYNTFNKILINNEYTLPNIKIYRTDKEAVLPFKNRESDAGYDITIIKETKVLNNKTKLYDTGIKMNIPNGYYVEIVPRSSLSKSGYMLANSVGIIDQSYRGNIFVALTKIVDESPNIELPFKCCQMIIRKQIYGTITEQFSEFEKTDRDTGGFGSTN